jgi:protein-S-isoprenylcysteine O-methyltransferase Ste14
VRSSFPPLSERTEDMTNLTRGIYGRVSPRRSNPGGDPIRLVGADSPRTFLVLGSDPQAKPSPSGHRSVRFRHPIYTGLLASALATTIAQATPTALEGWILVTLGLG